MADANLLHGGAQADGGVGGAGSKPVRVLCVDDNEFVAEALRRKLQLEPGFAWCGWLSTADGLVETAVQTTPDVVLLDIDMPGRDPFAALRELVEKAPAARVMVLSGHVRAELIDKAISAGAWGYMSKNERSEVIMAGVRNVAAGRFTLGPEAEAECARR